MPISKFQENLSIINNCDQQFGNFFESLREKNHFKQQRRIRFQQKCKQQDVFDMEQFSTPTTQFQHNPEDKCNSNKMEKSKLYKLRHDDISRNRSLHEVKIANLSKINPGSSQFFEQISVKKQHSGQQIQLKSVNELPAWLFDHIKKKNLDKLRNFHINTNLSRFTEDNQDGITTDRYGTNLKPTKQSKQRQFNLRRVQNLKKSMKVRQNPNISKVSHFGCFQTKHSSPKGHSQSYMINDYRHEYIEQRPSLKN